MRFDFVTFVAVVAGASFTTGSGAAESLIVKARLSPDSAYRDYPTRTLEQLPGFPLAARDSGLDSYGGVNAVTLTATGFFRVERVKGRWRMIDPEGHPMVFMGVSATAPGTGPGSTAAFAAKFGSREAWADSTLALIRANGFNGIGAWSDTGAFAKPPRRIPYTLVHYFMGEYGKQRGGTFAQPGHTGYPHDLIFVFDSAFAAFCGRRARELAALRDDPYLVGYYSDNEMPLPLDALDRYLGLDTTDPGFRAARAWLTSRKGAGARVADITRDDREAFMGHIADIYYGTVARAIRKYDPHHLYLGSRNNQINVPTSFYRACGKYVDVVSLNIYHLWGPPQFTLHRIAQSSGRPLLATEWYAKADDSKLPNYSGAGWIVATQRERGLYYQHFALALLQSRDVVGWKWFKYLDNDTLQKGAEQSNNDANKGIVTVDYRPYGPMLTLMRDLNLRANRLCAYFDTLSPRVDKELLVDASQGTLTAYRLTNAQAAQFQTSGRIIPRFWHTAWTGRDSLTLSTSANSYPGRDAWNGPNDAGMCVKAGWTDAGLCLNVRVVDDTFMAGEGARQWSSDVVEVFADTQPANALDTRTLFSPNGWSLTTSSRQFQFCVVSGRAQVYAYDTLRLDWYSSPLVVSGAGASVKAATAVVDSTTRVLDVFIPWASLGWRAAPPDGTRLAFTPGYNDMDRADGRVACLRWTRGDPYQPLSSKPWGELVVKK